ncbi:hypothetical protein LOAG_15761, partial [Loa loa]
FVGKATDVCSSLLGLEHSTFTVGVIHSPLNYLKLDVDNLVAGCPIFFWKMFSCGTSRCSDHCLEDQ